MNLKAKIIDVAYKQFSEKGFANTTIASIIGEVECSKGGFYHHFKSKEEILNLIIENYINEIDEYFDQITHSTEKLSTEHFNEVYEYIIDYKIKQSTEWPALSKVFSFSNNQSVIRVIEKRYKESVTKVYETIIYQGIKQGEFNVTYPSIAAEYCTRQFLWIFETISKIHLSNSDENALDELIDFSELSICNLLGVDVGSIVFKEKTMAYKDTILAYFERRKI